MMKISSASSHVFSRKCKVGLTFSNFSTFFQNSFFFFFFFFSKFKAWLETAAARKLVLVLSSIEPVEVLERWTFDIETTPAASDNSGEMATAIATKSLKEINGEIAAIMRQISASVTFLPLLETACSFDLLVYTAQGVPVPVEWEESAPRYIENAQHVRLRSVDTTLHSVDTTVAYAVHA
jgi:mitotic spindle assembly checkpoint protein MAD2